MDRSKIMPNSADAEEAVIGCIIKDKKIYDKVEPYLSDPEVWYNERCKILWGILSVMVRNDDEVDLVTINSRIDEEKRKKGIDAVYLSIITEPIYSVNKGVAYAKSVYEKYIFRKIVKIADDINKKAYDENNIVYELLADAYALFGELIELRPSAGFDVVKTITSALNEIVSRETSLIQCNWDAVNSFAGGFTRGEISIVGGRPGHGETTFLMNLTSHFVIQGLKVMLFNRELPNNEVIKKLMCIESGKLSYRKVRNGIFTKTDESELQKIAEDMKVLYASERFQMFDTIQDMSKTAIEIKKFKPDIVIDDYIQLIEPSRNIDQRRLQLERICNDYKWIAKTQKCAVILASQLNRALESREKSEPQLSDLAESGAIEQVAENVYFTYYGHKTGRNKDPHKITLFARKVRYGNTGSHTLGYDGDKCKIYGTYEEFEKAATNQTIYVSKK